MANKLKDPEKSWTPIELTEGLISDALHTLNSSDSDNTSDPDNTTSAPPDAFDPDLDEEDDDDGTPYFPENDDDLIANHSASSANNNANSKSGSNANPKEPATDSPAAPNSDEPGTDEPFSMPHYTKCFVVEPEDDPNAPETEEWANMLLPGHGMPEPTEPVKANRIKPKLLKADRTGIGGPKTEEGKAISSRNSLKHGYYAKTSIPLTSDEDRNEYEAIKAAFEADFQPVDTITALLLYEIIATAWHMHRVEDVDYRAAQKICDMSVSPSKLAQTMLTGERIHSSLDRRFYRHVKELKALLKEHADKVAAEAKAAEEKNPTRDPNKRYNEDGEEMDPNFPQRVIRKLSCEPDSRLNEVLEFDRTLSGKHSVKRTPLRDWKNGALVGPHFKPAYIKGDWPEHLLGPWAKDPDKYKL